MMGFAGQLSLGHALYVGLGAYTAAALFVHFGMALGSVSLSPFRFRRQQAPSSVSLLSVFGSWVSISPF